MLAILGSFVDFLHALLMIAWVVGLPLLFWHRYPRLTKWYAIYAVSFIVLSQGSQLLTGECFLTAISAALWGHGAPPGSSPDEWFTVRFARAVFHLSPSHHAISRASEVLILLTSVGLLLSMHRHRRHDDHAHAGS